MGNGITVWNNLEYEHGDYKTVAHIAADRTVTFYDDEMPESVRKIIIEEAETSDARISATQNIPVFSTPPREKELSPHAQAVQPLPLDNPAEQAELLEKEMQETPPQAAPSSVPPQKALTQEDIDGALQEWNGIPESKQTVIRYMQEHGRERGTAAWLRQEYGDDLPVFPVTTESAAGDIAWTRVQRDLARLIQEDRFLTEEDRQELEATDPKEVQGKNTEPITKEETIVPAHVSEYVTPGGIVYHAGDSLDSYAQEGRITRITVDHVTDGYVSLTSESWPGQSPLGVVREAFEKNLDNGVYKFIPETIEGNVPASTRMSADEIVKIPLTMEAALEYESLKQQYPDALIGFEQHGNYEFYGDDAEKAARIIKARILEKKFPGGRTAVTGFPAKHWAAFFRQLWRTGTDVYLAGEKPDGTHEETKYLLGKDYLPLHVLVHINQRAYEIQKVDYEQNIVTLRDRSPIPDARFPLIREEETEYVRSCLEEEPDFPMYDLMRYEESEQDRNQDSSAAQESEHPLPDSGISESNMNNDESYSAPRMMETVVELTPKGYQVTETRPVHEYQYDCMYHDIAYLDGQAYQAEKIGLLEVTFQPLETENVYPVLRVESRERLEILLAQDERNKHGSYSLRYYYRCYNRERFSNPCTGASTFSANRIDAAVREKTMNLISFLLSSPAESLIRNSAELARVEYLAHRDELRLKLAELDNRLEILQKQLTVSLRQFSVEATAELQLIYADVHDKQKSVSHALQQMKPAHYEIDRLIANKRRVFQKILKECELWSEKEWKQAEKMTFRFFERIDVYQGYHLYFTIVPEIRLLPVTFLSENEIENSRTV